MSPFSGFASSAELAEEIGIRYQQFYDEGYVLALEAERLGMLDGPRNLRVGDATDQFAMTRIENWLEAEGIRERAGGLVQVDRWLRDPSGSGLYVQPDIRIPAARQIYEGTIGVKFTTSHGRAGRQINGYLNYASDDRVTIIRPQRQVENVHGSYSIIR